MMADTRSRWAAHFDHCVVCGSTATPHQAKGLCVECYRRWLQERFELPAASKTEHWAREHDRCVHCGTSEKKHRARGLCVDCYSAWTEERHRPTPGEQSQARKKVFAGTPTEVLAQAYLTEGRSLQDLAREYGCTRQAIYSRLLQAGVARRTKSDARALALERGKLTVERATDTGEIRQVTLQPTSFDHSFFKTWSPAMAYVLGLLLTDGNLMAGSSRAPGAKTTRTVSSVKLFSKDPEVVEKAKVLLASTHRIGHRPQKGIRGELYVLDISDEELYDDLLRLGLTPKKSLTIDFPDVPTYCLRHFIRGCWDGDGTVYLEGDNPARGCAGFVSGSLRFVEAMEARLVGLGLPPVTVHHETRGSGAWYFRYHGAACARLAHVLYHGVDDSMLYSRKHSIFMRITEHYRAAGQ